MQREETNDRTQEFSDSFEIVENPLKPDTKMSHYEQLYWREMTTIGMYLGVKGLTHFKRFFFDINQSKKSKI